MRRVASLFLFSALLCACSSAPSNDGAPDYEVNARGDGGASTDEEGSDVARGDDYVPPEPTTLPVTHAVPTPPVTAPAAAGWCATHPATFCADFDAAALPSKFASMDGKSLAIGSATGHPLVLGVAAATSGTPYTSKLVEPFDFASADMTLAFDFSPIKASKIAGGALLVAAIDFNDNAAARYSVRIVYHLGRLRLEEIRNGMDTVFHPSFDVPSNVWSRLKLDVIFNASGGSSQISVADQAIGKAEPLSPPVAMIRRPTLLVGAVYGTTPHESWELAYDNVTMDVR